MLGYLNDLRRTYSDDDQLAGIAWLLDRTKADFITALDAALAGLNGVAFDAMRDVMEIEYLLRDFRYDPSAIARWLSDKHRRDFMPVKLRERHARKLGVAVKDLPDSQDYKIHSEGLHVSPGFVLSISWARASPRLRVADRSSSLLPKRSNMGAVCCSPRSHWGSLSAVGAGQFATLRPISLQ